jgi:hypothetical protein
LLLGLAILAAVGTAAEPPPDLTQTSAGDRSQTYNLGATGLRGWIHTGAASTEPTIRSHIRRR